MRLTLARPFFASGLTRWDGWFNLSFGTKILFEQEYKLHVFGAEFAFPMPDIVAAMASTAEIVLPMLLAFGLLTRWAALGLLCMTGVIQLTYPDGWANYHLYWAAMALAIMTFGPGAASSTASSASTAGAQDAGLISASFGSGAGFLGHRPFHDQDEERDHERQHRRHPEGVEIGQRSRLLLTQVFELPHANCWDAAGSPFC